MTPFLSLLPAFLMVVVLTGCATSLSSGHAPRVLPKGKFETGVATGALLPVGMISGMVDSGVDAARRISQGSRGPDGVTVDEQTAKDAALAVAVLSVQPPAAITEFTVRYGILDWWEAGLRLSGPAIRLETHGQILRGDWNLVGGIAAARHAFDSPVLGLLDTLKLADFSRSDVEATLIAGREWRYGSLSFGPKAVWSKFSIGGLLSDGERVVVPRPDGGAPLELLTLDSSWLVGGFVGGRVGWKYVWLTAELGLYRAWFAPTVLGERRDLGGLVVFPQIGLTVRPFADD